MDVWEALARQRHMRLPQHKTPLTTGRMIRLFKAVKVDISWYQQWSGFRSLKGFIEANPEWSARAFAGLLLESSEPSAVASLVAQSEDSSEPPTRLGLPRTLTALALEIAGDNARPAKASRGARSRAADSSLNQYQPRESESLTTGASL